MCSGSKTTISPKVRGSTNHSSSGRVAGQVQDDVRVIGPRRTGRADQHAPAHPQVDHQRVAGVERAHDVLAATADRK